MSAECEEVTAPFGPPDVEWKKTSYSSIPETAVPCGTHDKENIFAGRVVHHNELLIGTVIPEKQICHFSAGGHVYKCTDYEIMTVPCGEPLTWIEVQDRSSIPENLLVAGKSKDKKVLYIGRTKEAKNSYIGWVDLDELCLHVAVDNEEKVYSSFEILVHKYLDRLCICPPCPPEQCERPPDFPSK